MFASACYCTLTHSSPGAACGHAVALRVQVDVGCSRLGPAPGKPSFASGPHIYSSLWVEDGARHGADERRGQMGDW